MQCQSYVSHHTTFSRKWWQEKKFSGHALSGCSHAKPIELAIMKHVNHSFDLKLTDFAPAEDIPILFYVHLLSVKNSLFEGWWWLILLIPALGGLVQAGGCLWVGGQPGMQREFRDRLQSYREKPVSKINTTTMTSTKPPKLLLSSVGRLDMVVGKIMDMLYSTFASKDLIA